MGNELVSVSMKNYLSAPAISRYVEEMLGTNKGSFIATVTSLVNGNYKLQNCDKSTILMACLKAVGMKLPIEPSLGFAYVIPYGDKAQFQLSYKGLVQLALRTGNYIAMNSIEVREGEFKGRDSLGDPIVVFSEEEERLKRKIIGYMAGFKTRSGMTKIAYWTTSQVEEHALRFSQGYKSFKAKGKSTSTARSGNLENPWETDFSGMACKTVLKNVLSKYGELSIEIQDAIKYDQAVIGMNAEFEETINYIDNQSGSAVSDNIDKKEQDLLLNSYTPEVISEALMLAEMGDITEIGKDGFNKFVVSCKKIKEEYDKIS